MTSGHWSRAQRGLALVTVLFIIVLGTIAAVAMTERQHINTRQTANLVHGDQAFLYVLGGESWAELALLRDLRDDTRTLLVDDLTEDWATRLPQTLIEGGSIGGYIEDLQGRFNLNMIYRYGDTGVRNEPLDSAHARYFQRLLVLLNIDPGLVDTLADWNDPDTELRYPYGAEDAEYLEAEPSYRAANGFFADESELLLLQSMSPELMTKLAPYVTALPGATKINVNTAPPVVLMAIADEIDTRMADAIVQRRKQRPFDSTGDFRDFLFQEGLQADDLPRDLDELIGVASSYFAVHSQVEVGRARLRMESHLFRSLTGDVRVLQRTRRPV